MTKNLYTPEGFDPLTYLPKPLWKHADAARYLLHIIEWHRLFHHRPRDEYVHLKASYLNAVMGRHAGEIRTLLDVADIIDIDPQYFVGARSRGYRLGPKVRDATFRRHPVGKKVGTRLERNRMTKPLDLAVHKHLYSWLSRVEVDHDAAMNSLTTRDELIDKYIPLDMIVDGQFYLLPDEYGRVHSNVSSLSKSLRPYLHFADEKLVLMDLKNSQPFFLSPVLLNFYANDQSLNSFYASNNKCKRGRGEDGAIMICNLPPLKHPALAKMDLPDDVKAYIALTERGVLYEELGKVFGITDREEIKKLFFQRVLFCKPHKHPISTAFSGRFPSVAAVIDRLKEKDHRRLAHYLQRSESATIIHGVCERLRLDHPDTPVLTIHDCVMTTKPHVETVRAVLRDQFAGMSLSPSVMEQDFTLAA